MSYDYHGHWEGQTGHVAPLYHCSAHEDRYLNVESTLKYWIEQGAPTEKLILGIPAYGQSFTLSENALTLAGGNSEIFPLKTSGPGRAGKFTKVPGFLSYYEVGIIALQALWYHCDYRSDTRYG